jgi:hypothetical protein
MPLKSHSCHSYNFDANGTKFFETPSSESIASGFIKSLKIDDLKYEFSPSNFVYPYFCTYF